MGSPHWGQDQGWGRKVESVQDSSELRRVLGLARRTWDPAKREAVTERLSAALRMPGSRARLKPLQAMALAEFGLMGGCFAPLPTGEGKTLLTLLAPRMIACRSPLLIAPATLLEKTEEEEAIYRRDWALPPMIQKESYQTLGRVGSADKLDSYKPDCLMLDEGHFIKNPSAGVTRRVLRYLRWARDFGYRVHVLFLTGNPMGTSIKDFAHILPFCLSADRSPVPANDLDLTEWSRALDHDVPEHRRLEPGYLLELCRPGEPVTVGFQRRLRDTPGVILSEQPPLPIPLVCRTHVLDLDPVQDQAIARLRQDWVTPDEIMCADGMEVWRHMREITTGFYEVWVPRAPIEWRGPRSAWYSECRDILTSNRRNLDTEDQVARYVEAHPDHYPGALDLLRAWRKVYPTFTPNPQAHWISHKVIDWIGAWARDPKHGAGQCWIWTERPSVGAMLRERCGIPYYGQDGLDETTGRYSRHHGTPGAPAQGPACLSIRANGTGLNLQHYHRNLVVDVPASPILMEQMLARAHRPGQLAPAVSADFLIGSIEDVEAFWRAHALALRSQELTGQPQKICHALLEDVLTTHDVGRGAYRGPRWTKKRIAAK
jgi:hypothetical protein